MAARRPAAVPPASRAPEAAPAPPKTNRRLSGWTGVDPATEMVLIFVNKPPSSSVPARPARRPLGVGRRRPAPRRTGPGPRALQERDAARGRSPRALEPRAPSPAPWGWGGWQRCGEHGCSSSFGGAARRGVAAGPRIRAGSGSPGGCRGGNGGRVAGRGPEPDLSWKRWGSPKAPQPVPPPPPLLSLRSSGAFPAPVLVLSPGRAKWPSVPAAPQGRARPGGA